MNDRAEHPIVVIGAGAVGICCALYLQRDGRRVLLLDPLPPGSSASSGNAGMLAMGGVVPEAMPGIVRRVPGMLADPEGPLAIRWRYLPALLPWLVRYAWSSRPSRVEEISLALASLAREVLPALRPLLAEAGAADLVKQMGWLHLFETEEAFESTRPATELRHRRGVEVIEVPPEELRQLEPDLAPIFARGLLFPDYAHTVDPLRLVGRLAEHFVRGGGEIRTDAAIDVETEGGAVTAVQAAGARIPTAGIVLSAGAWSKPLARRLGHRLPLETERGYHVMLADPGIEVRRPLASAEGGFAITPMAEGLRIAGTVELAGLHAPPNPRRHEAMLARASRMLPGLSGRRSDWMGFRPSMPDTLPVIAPSSRFGNAWFAFGHGHRGLSFAAITGRIVAEMVAGRPPSVDLHPFRTDRFATSF